MSLPEPLVTDARTRSSRHESFLVYGGFRYLQLAALAGVAALVIYIVDDPYGERYGGSVAGYILGTAGALLILWLTWFGYRKRSYSDDHGRLVGRLSAHVYLGLALLVIGTLHTGFRFGWNVHTLAYALMCAVIASGIFGVFCYARYPRLMTENRGNMTMQQMLARIASLNDELRRGALSLDDATTALLNRSVETTEIGGSVWRQLTGHYHGCTTAAAIAGMEARSGALPPETEVAWREARLLLDEKATLLTRIRSDVRIKAIMEIWLYFHVPLSFALLAALLAHVVSVFFLW